MTARMVTADALRAAVRLEDLIEPVAEAFRQSSAGRAQNGLLVLHPAERPELGDVYVKTGVLRGQPVYIVKVAPWFAANRDAGMAQGGFVAVCDSATGHTLAIMDDQHFLSDLRTAAAGALAARLFAPPVVETAAVLGAGTQAYWQAVALYHERRFDRLVIWARDGARAEQLRQRLRATLPDPVLELSDDLEATVRRAEVLLTATLARTPLVRGAWLRPGQHITSVGADDPDKCELDGEALARARVFVDATETALANGNVARAVATGDYRSDQLAGEIGDVLAGRTPGRRTPQEITIVSLVGIGAQDLFAAQTALRRLGWGDEQNPGSGA